MAFSKNGEIKVFKKGKKVSPKLGKTDESNRYTVDDLVSNSKEKIEPEVEEPKEEDVSN